MDLPKTKPDCAWDESRDFFRKANLGPRLEVASLIDSREKSVDILLPAWDDDRDFCEDMPLSLFLFGAVLWTGAAARRVKERKIFMYETGCSANRLIF